MNWMERAKEFDRKNPHVYALFKKFAFELIEAGVKRTSADVVYNRIRWETAIQTKGDTFKINENFKAYFARRFIKEHPQYEGFFAFRRLRSVA